MTPEPPITKPKVLLVEGRDEEFLFLALIKKLGLDDIDIRAFGGVAQFRSRVKTLPRISGYGTVRSIGVVRDADDDTESAFQSVCDSLLDAGLPQPDEPLQATGSDPRVSVMIVPTRARTGMLEDVCLASVADDPAMLCVEEFFECLGRAQRRIPTHLSKARVRTFLASREVLEEAHFEFIKRHLDEWRQGIPNAPSVEKVHAFLASRYKPTLDLGQAAHAGYWDFDHPAFAEIREFLTSL